MKKRKLRRDLLFAAAILILVLVMLYSGLRILESTVLRSGASQEQSHISKTVTRDGVAYYPRQDITTILVMGIDREGPVEASDSYRNPGAADMVAVVVLDQTNNCYSILNLNRDMMVEMPVLGIGGKQGGTAFGQLALSHTYGTGLADSAENTRATVSGLLLGLDIDYYVAMNMDAIGILNDAVGGVTVNVTEDFSAVDPTITKGEITLNRSQAMSFVRSRKDVGTQLNLSRMERHKEYLQGLAFAVRQKAEESASFVAEVYDQVDEYMVTDCSLTVLSGFAERYADFPLREIVTVEGENRKGGEFYEFYPDQEKLDALILRLFYAPKENQ